MCYDAGMKALREIQKLRVINPDNHAPSVKILDGHVTLFKRADSKVWWSGFYFKRVHIRASTKTSDLEAAKSIARAWFFEQRVKLARGIAPTTRTKSFRYAADLALAQFRLDAEGGRLSKSYVNGIRKLLKPLCELIGDGDIAKVNQAAWT